MINTRNNESLTGEANKNTNNNNKNKNENKNKNNNDNNTTTSLMDTVGKLFMVGFEGNDVTDEVRLLITKYRVSCIILSGKNFINATQAKKLIHDLQLLAMKCNYKFPIIFVIDEEGGMLNSLFDKKYITQFPGAMSLGATGSQELTYQVYRAIAKELKSIGFSMYLGPVLDVLKNTSNTLLQQMIGVRSYGYDLDSVLKLGSAAAQAFKDEKMFNCGKHFPGYGSATVNSNFELPMIFETAEQLMGFNLVPYKELIKEDLLDSILVGGCAVPRVNNNDLHACLSPTIVTNILREKLQFNGVVISECLLLEALDRNFGVVQGCISAFSVGCDLIMLCSNFGIQEQAILGLTSVIEDGLIDRNILNKSLARIDNLYRRLPTWPEIIENSGFLSHDILSQHRFLSKLAYEKSITVIRDAGLPITKYLNPNVKNENTILLLTPLICPLYETVDTHGNKSHINNIGTDEYHTLKLNYGEDVFIKLGKLLSQYRPGYRIYHTSYNSNGLTSFHEELILKSKVILFFSAETTNNLYQVGVSKHVSMLCNSQASKFKKNGESFTATTNRKMIIISVSSPTDFLYDINIGGLPTGYICTYDYTINALSHLPKVLFGDYKPVGKIPGLISNKKIGNCLLNNTKKKRMHSWLVEIFSFKRDWGNLVNLLKNNNYLEYSVADKSLTNLKRLYIDNENHRSFVVRNTSSNTILGISSTWVYQDQNSANNNMNVGNFFFLLVDKNKRNIAIGHHLHIKTIKYLFEDCNCGKIYLGRVFPKLTIINDLMLNVSEENTSTLNFFKSFGWNFSGNCFSTRTKNHKSLKRQKSITLNGDSGKRISTSTLLVDKKNGEGNDGDESKSKLLDYDSMKSKTNSSALANINCYFKDSNQFLAMKLLNRTIRRKIRYLMKLDDISSWKVAENLVRQLQVVGIMFDICKNPADVFALQRKQKSYNGSIDDTATVINNNKTESDNSIGAEEYDDYNQFSEFANNNYEIYLELYKDYCTTGEKQYLDESGNLDIIVALEPTRRSVVGSLIVFNGKSKFSKFFPFLEFSRNSNINSKSNEQEFVCITGHFIDPLYTTLSEVFKLGLICTALMYVKSQYRNCSDCFITDIDEKQINSLKDNGFKIVEKYHNFYSVLNKE